MNTAGLLIANLERLLSSPTSAETIRKLIFDLAIRGQLTTQSDKDEPASVLIAKVIRTAQAEDRKFSAEPPVTERPFELPSGWEWVRLGNTGKIFNGTSASAGEKVRLSKTTDGLPFIATKDVGYGRDPLCYENGLRVPHGDKDYKVAKSGAVLICAEGGSAGKKIGQTNRPICFGNKLYANETWAGIEPGYILSLYQSNFFYGEFKAKMAGIIGGIARSDFRSLRIPLPPLAEQKRIVAKVDELMALCDRLEAQLKERDIKQAALAQAVLAKFTDDPTQENLQLLFHPSFSIEPEDIKDAVLSLAVRGKLVRQDLEKPPAKKLLEAIDAEKMRLISKKIIRGRGEVTPVTDDEVPFSVPSGWEWVRLLSVCKRIHYGYTASAKPELKKVRLLRITDIQDNAVEWDSVPGCEIDPEDVAQYALEKGDILVARTGGTVGKTYLVQEMPVTAVFASYLIRIQGCPPLSDRYLKIFLESPTYWRQLRDGARGAAQPNVNGQTLGNMVVSLPPLEEQSRIVAKVEDLMKSIDQLKAQVEASRTTGEKLLEAMVAELTSA